MTQPRVAGVEAFKAKLAELVDGEPVSNQVQDLILEVFVQVVAAHTEGAKAAGYSIGYKEGIERGAKDTEAAVKRKNEEIARHQHVCTKCGYLTLGQSVQEEIADLTARLAAEQEDKQNVIDNEAALGERLAAAEGERDQALGRIGAYEQVADDAERERDTLKAAVAQARLNFDHHVDECGCGVHRALKVS